MKYFSLVGSYEGGVFMRGRWIRVSHLNKIDKREWDRHQGPLTAAMDKAVKTQIPIKADELFKYLKLKEAQCEKETTQTQG